MPGERGRYGASQMEHNKRAGDYRVIDEEAPLGVGAGKGLYHGAVSLEPQSRSCDAFTLACYN
jgi:hypothetical protein